MSYKPHACYCSAGIDACALWRFYMPHLNLQDSRFIFTQGRIPMDLISEADVVWVQRMLTEPNRIFMEECQRLGMKVIYDLDDNVWNLPKYNPAKPIFDQYRNHFGICMEWADVMTVSTPALKSIAERHVGHIRSVKTKEKIPIKVLENYIDLNLFYPSDLPKDEDVITIGWAGSNTHGGDLYDVWQLLPKILLDYENVRMHFVGHLPPKEIEKHSRVKFTQWHHVSEIAGRMATWDWDIFLAPLEVNNFNRCKSSIKMQEAGAFGKPCLATDIENYTKFCLAGDKELSWQLCTFTSEWDRKLRELITNKELRKRLGLAMRANVENNFDLAKNIAKHKEIVDYAFTCN